MTALGEIRAFLAMPFPLDALQAMQRFIRGVEAALGRAVVARMVPPANVHLTLRFLGDIPVEMVLPIRDVVARVVADVPDLDANLIGLGAFPNVHRARVVWIGLEEPSGRLARIQREVEDGLMALGFDPEDKPFRAHVTVARVRSTRNVGELTRLVEANHATQIATCTLSEVVLYQSKLREDGPIYRIVERCPFKNREGVSQ